MNLFWMSYHRHDFERIAIEWQDHQTDFFARREYHVSTIFSFGLYFIGDTNTLYRFPQSWSKKSFPYRLRVIVYQPKFVLLFEQKEKNDYQRFKMQMIGELRPEERIKMSKLRNWR